LRGVVAAPSSPSSQLSPLLLLLASLCCLLSLCCPLLSALCCLQDKTQGDVAGVVTRGNEVARVVTEGDDSVAGVVGAVTGVPTLLVGEGKLSW
jgi:hypothetical protein